LEFFLPNHGAEKIVGTQQHIVVEKNVIDADDTFAPKDSIVNERASTMQFLADRKVSVVVQVRSRAHNPIHEASFHQWDDARAPQASRSERAGETHSNGHVGLEHFRGVDLTNLSKPSGIVSLKVDINQFFYSNSFRNWSRHNLLSTEEFGFTGIH
jgi:hypothetical protein